MTTQDAILRCLVAATAPMALDAICRKLNPDKASQPHSSFRRQVINQLGRLMNAGLAVSHKGGNTRIGEGPKATYSATAGGKAHVAAGNRIKSGPKGKRTGLTTYPQGARQRFWEAIRYLKKSTLAEMVEMVRRDDDPPPALMIDNARQYFRKLSRAGIVVVMGARAAGDAPTSNGFIRYALLPGKDLGPIAPRAGRNFVTDHNAGNATPPREPRIPYREGA